MDWNVSCQPSEGSERITSKVGKQSLFKIQQPFRYDVTKTNTLIEMMML
jgi:hypothetical protein